MSKSQGNEGEGALKSLVAQIALDGEFARAVENTSGLINTSYELVCKLPQGGEKGYLLQKINRDVFSDVEGLMQNVELVVGHIAQKLEGTGRRCLQLVPSRDGGAFVRDEGGEFWRCYEFIEGSESFNSVETELQAFEAGRAFGEFQMLVGDLRVGSLKEIISGFHNTLSRYSALESAWIKDAVGRAKLAGEEFAFIAEREGDFSCLERLKEAGELPLSVVHNDTKISNVLFERGGDKAICVIDLDTTMPGLRLHDFGDLVRTACNPAREESVNLDEVQMRLPIFRALLEGYYGELKEVLSPVEVAHLVTSARVITLELAMRFLTDFLEGDRYFRTTQKDQNLHRTRVQLRLVQEMERVQEQMEREVTRVTGQAVS